MSKTTPIVTVSLQNYDPVPFVALALAAAVVMSAAAGCAPSAQKEKPERTWDGLELVEREGLDKVYMRPGASLAPYKRVMLRHAEVSFDQNWKPFEDPGLKSHNVDPNKIVREVQETFGEITERELRKGSYDVVSNPDDDVLRVVPLIADLFVSYRDTAESGRGGAPIIDTGHMMLVVELRDSVTNTLLARVLDRVEAGGADQL